MVCLRYMVSFIFNRRADRSLQPVRPTCCSRSVFPELPTDKGVKASLVRSSCWCWASTSKPCLSSSGSCFHSALICFIFEVYSSVEELAPSIFCLQKTFHPESRRSLREDAFSNRAAFIASVSKIPRERLGWRPSLVECRMQT